MIIYNKTIIIVSLNSSSSSNQKWNEMKPLMFSNQTIDQLEQERFNCTINSLFNSNDFIRFSVIY